MPPKRRAVSITATRTPARDGGKAAGTGAKRVKAEHASLPAPATSKKEAGAAKADPPKAGRAGVKKEAGVNPPGPYPRPACVSPATAPLPVRAPCGRLRFADLPPPLAKAFRPRLTPEQVIRAGAFGGIYFNPVGGKPGIHGRHVSIDAAEFPPAWFEGLPVDAYAARRYDASRNAFGVKAGQDQAFWEEKGWMRRDLDPRGWFQWYCRFYCGRRTTDGEDERQIGRWSGVAGAKGRWRRALANKAAAKGLPAARAHEASPVISQTLLHWADRVTDKDVSEALGRVKE